MTLWTSKLRYKFIFACIIKALREKETSVTSCSCARIIDYTSSILVKIINLSQVFLHMLTLKALTKLSVTSRYGSDLNDSMNQYR